MPNALQALEASRLAEERARMTHWQPQDHHAPVLNPLADFTPYGAYVYGGEAIDDYQEGHYGSAGLNALVVFDPAITRILGRE